METWRFSIPGKAEDAPELDADGSESGINQSGPVFFLQYSWTLDPSNPVPDDRYATVPAGTAILADLDGWFNIVRDNSHWTLDALAEDNRAWTEQWTEFLTLVIDDVEIPIDNSNSSPFFTHAAFNLPVPKDSATMELIGVQPNSNGKPWKFAVDEWIALIKPLSVGEHLIEIKGGNTGLGDPQGTDQNIWWNWVKWHITVTP